MKTRFLLTLLILAIPCQADESFQAMFDRANRHYETGDFEQAKELYVSLVRQGCVNGKVYYNLANTHLKLNDIGRSIAYYLKARNIDPRDADIQANLAIARGLVNSSIPQPQSGWAVRACRYLTDDLTVNETAVVFIILYLAAATTLATAYLALNRKTRRRMLRLLTGIMVFLVFSGILLAAGIYRADIREIAVAVDSEISAMSGPGTHFSDVFKVQPGYEMTVTRHQSGWIEIKLANGYIGWVPETNVVMI